MARFAKRGFLLKILLTAVFLFTAIGCDKSSLPSLQKTKKVATPTEKKKFAWRQKFKVGQFDNLAMQFSGKRNFVFLKDYLDKTNPVTANLFIVQDEGGKVIDQFELKGNTNEVSISGNGKDALVHQEDGRLVLLKGIGSGVKKEEKGSADYAVLAHSGEHYAALNGEKVTVVSTKGETLWTIDGNFAGGSMKFPFFGKNETLLITLPDGTVALYEKDKELWSKNLGGAPISVSSAFLKADMIAVSTSGKDGRVYFLDITGEEIGTAPFSGGAKSISCSNQGEYCAVYGNGEGGQKLSLLTPGGMEIWSYQINAKADHDSRAILAGQGHNVIAGFQEAGKWSLYAWNAKGDGLWYGSVDGDLRDFRLSWNGKLLAAITERTLEFYSW